MQVLCCAFSPDGRVLVSGSVDNTLRIWDIESGQTINTLTGHSSAVRESLDRDGDRDWKIGIWSRIRICIEFGLGLRIWFIGVSFSFACVRSTYMYGLGKD